MFGKASPLERALQNRALAGHVEGTEESPEARLTRMLSTQSVVSTASSFATRQQEAATDTSVPFREIGTGSIGKVFEHPGTVFVYKLPLSDKPEKLWNNYVMHKRVQYSFQKLPYLEGQVEVPRCFWYGTPATSAFWNEHLERFPDTPQFPRQPRHVLCMERVFPLPQPIRHALVDKFCPPQARDSIKESEANKDCLIRPCLGRLKYGAGASFFSLRNFILHSNQIHELGLNVSELNIGMAHALAVLHWHTNIDAKDVEFVLGSSPVEGQMVRSDVDISRLLSLKTVTSTYEETTHAAADFTKRATSLWLLDFDDCEDITLDEKGVDKAVKAFLDTNFYCPKPNTGNDFIESAWKVFSAKYVVLSDKILRKERGLMHLSKLPRLFISKINEKTAIRRQQQPEAQPTSQAPPRGGGTGARAQGSIGPSRSQRGRGSGRARGHGRGHGPGHGPDRGPWRS